jgi:hypothetical protein
MRQAVLGTLTAVGLLLTVGAAGATAMPEVGRCAERTAGKYTDSGCMVHAARGTGSHEWVKGAVAKGFTATGGEAVLEGTGGSKFVCTATSAVGSYLEINGAIKSVHEVHITFTGCGTPVGSCETAGQPEGQLLTPALRGNLIVVSGQRTANPIVGLRLRPEAAKGAFVAFQCDSGLVNIRVGVKPGTPNGGDCAFGVMSPLASMLTSFQLAFSGKEGTQEPQSGESAPTRICNLEASANGGAWERTDLQVTMAIANEEPLELRVIA